MYLTGVKKEKASERAVDGFWQTRPKGKDFWDKYELSTSVKDGYLAVCT